MNIINRNTKKGQTDFTLYGHLDSVECVKWGGNGLLYSCSRDRTIKVSQYNYILHSVNVIIQFITFVCNFVIQGLGHRDR